MSQITALDGERTEVQQGVSQLDQLKRFTTVVADTGDFESLEEYCPQDATTNPSLILKAVQMPAYASLVERVIRDHQNRAGTRSARVIAICQELQVRFGLEILKIVPGRVSTETDAAVSFNPTALYQQARDFIRRYEQYGTPRERVLIKIASTWEGIRTARVLEREGIRCNLTLLFNMAQAVACADARVQLISPFVGRILDWYKARSDVDFSGAKDPGVVSVREIYNYYKRYGHRTEVMGASFRNKQEILELAGCDLLTISPKLLAELEQSTGPVERKLVPELAQDMAIPKISMDEATFRWQMNEDAMASDKLAEGIRSFHADAMKLATFVDQRLR